MADLWAPEPSIRMYAFGCFGVPQNGTKLLCLDTIGFVQHCALTMGAEKYDRARALVEEEIGRLQGVLQTLDWMEAHGVSPDDIIAKLEHPGRARPAPAIQATRRIRINGSVRPRSTRSVAASGETLPQAIDRILIASDRRLFVTDIVAQLDAEGREFPKKARKDTLVRGALNRCKSEYDWGCVGKKPRKWFKKKVNSDQQAAAMT